MQNTQSLFNKINQLEIEQENIISNIELANNELIEALAKEYNISIGDKVHLNDYDKPIIIHKFFISRSRRYRQAQSPMFSEWFTKEEKTIALSREFALWAECYEVNKNGSQNKTIVPDGNRYCLEDITLMEGK